MGGDGLPRNTPFFLFFTVVSVMWCLRARDANVIEADAVVGGGALSRVLGRALKETGGNGEQVERCYRRKTFSIPTMAPVSI